MRLSSTPYSRPAQKDSISIIRRIKCLIKIILLILLLFLILPKYLDIPHFTFVMSKETKEDNRKNFRKNQKSEVKRKLFVIFIM